MLKRWFLWYYWDINRSRALLLPDPFEYLSLPCIYVVCTPVEVKERKAYEAWRIKSWQKRRQAKLMNSDWCLLTTLFVDLIASMWEAAVNCQGWCLVNLSSARHIRTRSPSRFNIFLFVARRTYFVNDHSIYLIGTRDKHLASPPNRFQDSENRRKNISIENQSINIGTWRKLRPWNVPNWLCTAIAYCLLFNCKKQFVSWWR